VRVAPPQFADRSDSSTQQDQTSDESFIPFETSVLISTDRGFVLGASVGIADGEIFVTADERLPADTDVDITFVAPDGGDEVHADGRVTGDDIPTDRHPELDATDMRIAIESVEDVR
jgi:hypothetical protein